VTGSAASARRSSASPPDSRSVRQHGSPSSNRCASASASLRSASRADVAHRSVGHHQSERIRQSAAPQLGVDAQLYWRGHVVRGTPAARALPGRGDLAPYSDARAVAHRARSCPLSRSDGLEHRRARAQRHPALQYRRQRQAPLCVHLSDRNRGRQNNGRRSARCISRHAPSPAFRATSTRSGPI
jgi:hypothetical protein